MASFFVQFMFFVHVLFLSCIDDLVFLTDVLSIRSFFYFEQTDVAIVCTLEGGNRKKDSDSGHTLLHDRDVEIFKISRAREPLVNTRFAVRHCYRF